MGIAVRSYRATDKIMWTVRLSTHPDRLVLVFDDPSQPDRPPAAPIAPPTDDDGPVKLQAFRRTISTVDQASFEALAGQSLYVKDPRGQQTAPGQAPPSASGANWVPRAGLTALDGFSASVDDFVLRIAMAAKSGPNGSLLLIEVRPSLAPAP